MANYIASDTDLTAVANAIRTKGGTAAALAFPSGFVSAIAAIPSGGGGGSFTFNPANTVSNNSAPDVLQSVLDAVQPTIGNVPFFASWQDGDKPSNYLTTLLYIPSGWKCGGNATSATVALASRGGVLVANAMGINITGTGSYVNISASSLYRCISLADFFEEVT